MAGPRRPLNEAAAIAVRRVASDVSGRLELAELLGVLRDPIVWVFVMELSELG